MRGGTRAKVGRRNGSPGYRTPSFFRAKPRPALPRRLSPPVAKTG